MSNILHMSTQILFLFSFLGFSLTLSFWQSSIIWQYELGNLLHSFGGLGDFFLQLYNWRKIWYGVVKFLTKEV